jgi:adenine-specific DNA-methyltransferase
MMQAELFEPQPRAQRPSDELEGEAFCQALPMAQRRAQGITFTPQWLVDGMLGRAAVHGGFDTIVDAGAGSGRFTFAALARFPGARVLAIEKNASLAAALRRRVHSAALQARVQVIEDDFRAAALPPRGRTLFIGNPPYVRHHDIDAQWKDWYRAGMAERGVAASQLAGLHAHFMLRTAQLLQPGDAWCFVTAAEWLDNGYGSAVRHLLGTPGGAGLRGVWLASADEPVFPDALVSAVVVEGVCAMPSSSVTLGRIAARRFEPTRQLDAPVLAGSARWSPLCQPAPLPSMAGMELGELFRITRGQVTGLNAAWVLPEDAPAQWRALGVPSVTRAREIIDGTAAAPDAEHRLKLVVDLPRDLGTLDDAQRAAAAALIERARAMGAHESYIARQRSPWFAVGMREPPQAFVSYMGRRPPVFVPNPRCVSFLNIAHGLYPRVPVSQTDLAAILDHLNRSTGLYAGRVYGGGLAKFEPSDIARLRLPPSVWEAAA